MRPIIKNESHGYVKPDGNPMTGGAWFSITFLSHKEIPIESLTGDQEITAWLTEHYGEETIYVEAYITSGYDNSTNHGGCEVDEWFDVDTFMDLLKECPLLNRDQKKVVWDKLDDIANDTDGYAAYA